ncbi:unnamed protein product [Musa acuminata subsp. burmannicoides]
MVHDLHPRDDSKHKRHHRIHQSPRKKEPQESLIVRPRPWVQGREEERHKLDLDEEHEEHILVSDIGKEPDPQELDDGVPRGPPPEHELREPSHPQPSAGIDGLRDGDRLPKVEGHSREEDGAEGGRVGENEAHDGKGVGGGEEGKKVKDSRDIMRIEAEARPRIRISGARSPLSSTPTASAASGKEKRKGEDGE